MRYDSPKEGKITSEKMPTEASKTVGVVLQTEKRV